MAILQSGDLSFEFCFSGFEDGWVKYQFYFKWQGEPLVRDDLLKKWNEYWGNRPTGAFLANADEADSFVPFLQKVLSQDKAEYWEPIEPDIMVAIYPEGYFPFLPSHHKLLYESPESTARRKAREALKKEKGPLPDDSYTFMVFVDAYNLRGTGAYYGQGLTLQLITNREKLEKFTTCLEHEYLEFKDRFQVDRQNEENKRMLHQLFTDRNDCAAEPTQESAVGYDQKEPAIDVHNGTDSKTKDTPEIVQKKRSMIAEALATASKVKDKPKKKK